MGYAASGVSFITATGVARRTGLPVADSERALRRLQAAGLAVSDSEGTAWRPDTDALAALAD
jgi:DNA-binding IclR family transcriptional regulator